jgi:membrane protein DedA with SNARE-associated domain
MFAILVLCGLGLPLPEEVTLLGSGLLVGWHEANFFVASAVCASAIVLGDSLIFFMGRHFGRQFLQSRFMRFILTRKRQARVRRLFARHGTKAVFIARFFAGVRIGVYAYAGQHGMRWYRFAVLDLLGTLISVPVSIWVGKFAAEQLGSAEEAIALAENLGHKLDLWMLAGAALLVAGFLVYRLRRRRRRERQQASTTPVVVLSGPAHKSGQGGR